MTKESKSMMKAFKYRLYPTRKQADILQFTLDRNRELYNAALEERREAWRMSRVSVTYNMQSAQLPQRGETRIQRDLFPNFAGHSQASGQSV
jgi:putative transposase